MNGRFRSVIGAVAVAAAMGLVAACGSSSEASVGHVHNLGLEGDRLVLGSHEGLWEQPEGGALTLVSVEPFDVMGLARDGDRWLASGHPGEGMDAPADLGLLESLDGGVTWRPVSLSGEVDFHRLVASGSAVMGVSAHDGALLRSDDDGRTWESLGAPPVGDIALSPTDSQVVVVTTAEGLARSDDGGRTFALLAGSPGALLLAWTDAGLFAVAANGQVHLSPDSGASWMPRGSMGGEPVALAADGMRLAGLIGDTVQYSTDGAASFAPRLTAVS